MCGRFPRTGCFWAILQPPYESEAGPCVVHGADLVVHHPRGEANSAQHVLSEVGHNARGLLGPGDPKATVWDDGAAKSGKVILKSGAAGEETDRNIKWRPCTGDARGTRVRREAGQFTFKVPRGVEQ